MGRGSIPILLALATTLLFTVATYAADQPKQSACSGVIKKRTTEIAIDEKTEVTGNTTITFYDKYIKDHLQMGVRSALRRLTDDDSGYRGGVYGSGTYLGTIYALDEKQNITPLLFNISYYFNEYIGFELAYDRIEAETVAFNTSTQQDKTDGDIIISGPTLTLLAQYGNSTSFTPYAGVGIGYYSSTFDADPEWTYSSEYNGAAYNHMDINSVTGWHLTVGTKWLFSKNWALDLSVQYVQADADATYTGYLNDEKYTTQTGHYPMDNVALRLGITYQF